GVLTFVFDLQVATFKAQGLEDVLARGDQRGQAFAQRDNVARVRHGKKLGVAPHVPATAGQVRWPHRRADCVEVVAREQHLAARGAHPLRYVRSVPRTTRGALEVRQIAAPRDGELHGFSLPRSTDL